MQVYDTLILRRFKEKMWHKKPGNFHQHFRHLSLSDENNEKRLLKTGTFHNFGMTVMVYKKKKKKKKRPLKNWHFPPFSVLTIIEHTNLKGLLKTGTFVLFQHFYVLAHKMRLLFGVSNRNKMWHKKQHFSTFPALIMMG